MKLMPIKVPETVKDEDVASVLSLAERVLNAMANGQGSYWKIESRDHCIAILAMTEKIDDVEAMKSYLHEAEEFMTHCFKQEVYI